MNRVDGVSKAPVVAMIFPRTIQEIARKYKKGVQIDIDTLKEFEEYDELLKYRDGLLHHK